MEEIILYQLANFKKCPSQEKPLNQIASCIHKAKISIKLHLKLRNHKKIRGERNMQRDFNLVGE